jgi:Fe-S cluster assembly ATP-binding protein
MKKILLKIENVEASIENKKILKKLNLEIKENEIHVIMGPNGCGKSTLSKIIAGHPQYIIQDGKIEFSTKNLLEMSPEIRSHEGVFLAFQYPLEISGVTNYDFLRIAFNEKQKYLNRKELTPLEFMEFIQKKLIDLQIPGEFLNRDLNQGFSGGEKKRNEILQMLLLEPKLIILDELDSGLDIDAIKIICDAITKNLAKTSSVIIITHYPRILNYFKPDFVHIMRDGKIIKTGNVELVEQLEKEGYQNLS